MTIMSEIELKDMLKDIKCKVESIAQDVKFFKDLYEQKKIKEELDKIKVIG